MDLSQFLKESLSSSRTVNEAFRAQDFERALGLIKSLLWKKGYGVCPFPAQTIVNGKQMTSLLVMDTEMTQAITLNFLLTGNSENIDSFSYISGKGNVKNIFMSWTSNSLELKVNADTYDCNGIGIGAFLRIVMNIFSGATVLKAIKSHNASALLTESYVETWDKVKENPTKTLKQKYTCLYTSIRNAKQAGDTEFVDRWNDELEKMKKALKNRELSDPETGKVDEKPIKGTVVTKKTPTQIKANSFLERFFEERSSETGFSPELSVFDKMEIMEDNIMNVIDNKAYGMIIAGAAGVGKTYRCTRLLNKYTGVEGVDWKHQKGSTSAAELYTVLFKFRKPGNILLIDDCDTVLTDKEACELLKAAADDKKVRTIGWGKRNMPITRDEEMYVDYKQEQAMWQDMGKHCDGMVEKTTKEGTFVEAQLPKSFYFQGGIIILTNMGLGKLPDALRNRGSQIDMRLTLTEIMQLIEGLIEHIQVDDPDAVQLDMNSKQKALTYLSKLAEYAQDDINQGLEVSINFSIRSFKAIATIFAAYPDAAKCEKHLKFLLQGMANQEKSGS